jgi:hypothetical protein
MTIAIDGQGLVFPGAFYGFTTTGGQNDYQ